MVHAACNCQLLKEVQRAIVDDQHAHFSREWVLHQRWRDVNVDVTVVVLRHHQESRIMREREENCDIVCQRIEFHGRGGAKRKHAHKHTTALQATALPVAANTVPGAACTCEGSKTAHAHAHDNVGIISWYRGARESQL